MSYAQKILEKYGWKEGDGLGKNSDGITKPLKPSLKFDKAGVGVDRAEEFNNHWWERVFNDAAKNVEIKKDGDNISVLRKNEESVEITTKNYSVRELKKKKLDSYDNFLSSATLVNTGAEIANPFKIEVDEIKLPTHKPLTDEELFAACGGRTAHKGARHGLKLSGKLARIEKQEQEMLLKMQTNSTPTTPELWTVVKSKKKNKRKKEEEPSVAEVEPSAIEENKDESKLNDMLYITEYCIKSKKKRKEKKQTEEELSKSLESFNLEKPNDEGSNTNLDENCESKKKNKKSKKNKNCEETNTNETEIFENCDRKDENEPAIEKFKKKNKKCKHGIDKDAKEAHKKDKKMKKKLRHITQDMQQSVMLEA